jgi:glycosyltransferase involved in cell wall biosynthesis
MQMPQIQPLLSITMPTRNRPQLLERALRSVVGAVAPVSGQVEVAVSDGSDDEASGQVVRRLLTGWPGGHRYVWNRPALPLVENMNRAVEISTGQWVMQLDDDDYLLPGAGAAMLAAIGRARPGEAVLLFGVEIVDANGVRRREQRFSREQYLEPQQALRRLLRNSSFVREPTAVVRRAALEQEGLFDPSVGDATDTDMWVRLFSRYGVRCLPQATCAYTIHEAAATTGMWHPGTIRANAEIFDRAVARGVVPEPTIRRWQADWYHQFILAGAYRRLRLGRRAEAREVLRLFDLPEVRRLGLSPRWLPVRAAFTAATAGAPRRAA